MKNEKKIILTPPHPHYPYRGPQRQPHLFMKNHETFKVLLELLSNIQFLFDIQNVGIKSYIKPYKFINKYLQKLLRSISGPKMDPKLRHFNQKSYIWDCGIYFTL